MYKWSPLNGKYCININDNKNFNMIILGTSGSGKSFLAKKILEVGKLNYTIFDVHGEYDIEGIKRLDASKISINPLSLLGQSPRERSLEVAYVLKSLFNLGNIQTIDLSNLIFEAYQEKGIYEEDDTTWILDPPNFRDILVLLNRKKTLATNAQEINKYQSIEPYLSFITNKIFMYNSINISEIINNPVIIDFSKIPTLEIRYILIDTILRSILSYMYVSGQSKLRKMIVIDEAHFVLSKESGLQLMEKLFAEGRKFGFGFILISQTSEYVKKLIPNSAYIFVLNMIEPGELEYISKLLGGSDMDIYKAIYNSLLRLPKGLIITRDILQDEIVLVRSS
ncbi:ATP-binding protein [Candidatus Acidianus copahuensis]|nr:ATP-binding protein [Candidatus Acidianus copahuensis]